MALTLPYPGQPALNSALASAPVLANITAIAQAIQAFDGSQINAGSIQAAALATSINPNTILHDTISSFVQSGLVWSNTSGLIGTMTGGTLYVGTSSAVYRIIVNGIGSYTFTASKDTYIDIDYNANIYYSAVANGAAAPSITANSVRVAKVITGATTFTSVTQTGYDSLLNLIYPTSPSQNAGKFDIGSFTNSGSGGGTFYYLNLGGLKMVWGLTAQQSFTSGYNGYTLNFPTGFFTTLTMGIANLAGTASTQTNPGVAVQNFSNTGVQIEVYAPGTGQSSQISAWIMGN